MRIIAGKYGGRRLVSFKADHIRPTTDRVKETVFNKLQFIIEGSTVLDLFSGTGSLAVEALSRGATFVQAVESSPKSLSIIRENKKLLGIGAELSISPLDVFKFLKRCESSFDIILVDPPFTKKIAHEVLMALDESSVLHENTEIFIESTSKETVEPNYKRLVRENHKSYGDKFLSHYILVK